MKTPANSRCERLRSRPATHGSRLAGHESRFTQLSSLGTPHRVFLIATQLLEIRLTHSQQTRELFLIATNSGISEPAPYRNNPPRTFLSATHPDSEICQPPETKRETIFLPQHGNASWHK